MLAQPRVIGRALDGEVERDLHAMIVAGADEATEVVERAKLRMHGVVPAFGTADGIWAAGIFGPGDERVVAPLAVGPPDRVDRSQIDDIEAALSDLRQPGDAVVECAMTAGNRALAPRDHLVPGAGAGKWPFGQDREEIAAREIGPLLRSRGGRRQLVGK